VIRSPRLLSDERLAILAGTGSDPAFAMLYRRFDGPLHGYCLSIVKNPDDARDVLQSAWMKALVALRAQARKAPVRPWLFRIVHNEAIDLIRRRRGEEPLIDSDRLGGTAGGADEEVEGRERMAEVVADLRGLPEGQRAALVMREWADLEYAEIALALATSEGNARQLVFSARSGLVESRAGRNESCDAIRLELAGADGRRLRNRRIRSHLDSCAACREFSCETKDRRRAAAAALLPWGPGGVELLGMLGAGGAAGGVTGGSALIGGLAKGAAVAALVTGGVGTAELAIKEPGEQPMRDRAGVVEMAERPADSVKAPSATVREAAAAVAVRKTAPAAGREPVDAVVMVADGGRAPDPATAPDRPRSERRPGDGQPGPGGGQRRDRRSGGGDGLAADGQRQPAPTGDGQRDGDSWDGQRDGDGDRQHSAGTHTDFLRAPSGSLMGG
jgi:RNA polymerase sigma factor (sigma-70 family)